MYKERYPFADRLLGLSLLCSKISLLAIPELPKIFANRPLQKSKSSPIIPLLLY